ncbi:hypothetical protein [Croceicoccus sp. Ery15]|uniref:hypothetical protein n=1 Tax=Croceicoccus sp. Ery15 TaxID=1703338 RepID=UPI001E4E0E26|nr:hypothetical protein [Croceicoccus sp. Ery15]
MICKFGTALAALLATTPLAAQNYDLDQRDDDFSERLTVIEEPAEPVIGPEDVRRADNRSGFETGMTLKIDGTYHLFISEMFERPHLDMRIAHWTSPDAVRWTRQGTVVDSVPGRSAKNPKSEVWLQGVIFDDEADRWNLFYIAYRGGNSEQGEGLNLDYEGTARRAVSQTPGKAGIGGPYEDVGVAMAPGGPDAAVWEGQQGLDSFFPYKVGDQWVALHGSHNHFPASPWQVGVATGSSLTSSEWTRVPSEQPSPMEGLFIENPIVEKLPNGHYIALYDANHFAPVQPDMPVRPNNSVGYSVSEDGIRWHQGRSLVVQSDDNNWASDLRTPLGLVAEGDGIYTLLYTARMKDQPFWAIGRVKVKLTTD